MVYLGVLIFSLWINQLTSFKKDASYNTVSCTFVYLYFQQWEWYHFVRSLTGPLEAFFLSGKCREAANSEENNHKWDVEEKCTKMNWTFFDLVHYYAQTNRIYLHPFQLQKKEIIKIVWQPTVQKSIGSNCEHWKKLLLISSFGKGILH